MCRYAHAGPCRDHYACFTCRKSYKWPRERFAQFEDVATPKCPQCAGPLEGMGLDFKAPRIDDTKQWEWSASWPLTESATGRAGATVPAFGP
jgi:hypothetical protein